MIKGIETDLSELKIKIEFDRTGDKRYIRMRNEGYVEPEEEEKKEVKLEGWDEFFD